jgi:hypothetical protein
MKREWRAIQTRGHAEVDEIYPEKSCRKDLA